MLNPPVGVTLADYNSAILNGNQTHARIVFPVQERTFTDDDICVNNGIVLNSVLNGEKDLTVGSAVCKEITINFINNGQFDGFDWTEEFHVDFGVEMSGVTQWVTVGYFHGSKPERTLRTDIITFVAYDRMKDLDVPVSNDFINAMSNNVDAKTIFEYLAYYAGFGEQKETITETAEKIYYYPSVASMPVEFKGSVGYGTNSAGEYGQWYDGFGYNIFNGHYTNWMDGSINLTTGEWVNSSTHLKKATKEWMRVLPNTEYYFKVPTIRKFTNPSESATVQYWYLIYYSALYPSDAPTYRRVDASMIASKGVRFTTDASAKYMRIMAELTEQGGSISEEGCVCIYDASIYSTGIRFPYKNYAGYEKPTNIKYSKYEAYYSRTVNTTIATAPDSFAGGNIEYDITNGTKVTMTHKAFKPLNYWYYNAQSKVYFSAGAQDIIEIPESDSTVPDIGSNYYKAVSYNEGISANINCVYVGQNGLIYCKSGERGFFDTPPIGEFYIKLRTPELIECEQSKNIPKSSATPAAGDYAMIQQGILSEFSYIKSVDFDIGDAYYSVLPQYTSGYMFSECTTYREVLGKIAEFYGCYGVITAENKLSMKWFGDHTLDYTITDNDYYNLSISETLVPAIDGLRYVYTGGNILNYEYPDEEATNYYIFYDNDLLMSDDILTATKRSIATQLIAKFGAFGSYYPITVSVQGNWMVEAGDIITVSYDGNKTAKFPIFVKTMTWGGQCTDEYENTGDAQRVDATNAVKNQYEENNKYIKKYTIQTGVGISEEGLTVSGEKSLYNISQARDIINNGIYDDQGMDASFGARHRIYDKANTAYVSVYPAVNMHVSGADSRVYSPGFVIEGMHGGSSDWKIGMNYKRIEGETYTDDSPGDPTFGVLEGSATLPERYILNGFSRIFGNCVKNNLTTEDKGYVLDPRAVKATNYERVSGNFTGNSNVSKYYKVIGNGMLFVSAYTRASNSSDTGTTTTTIYQCDDQKENIDTLAFDSDRQQTANTARPAASASLARYFEDGECIRVYHACTKNGSNAWCHVITTMGCQVEEF